VAELIDNNDESDRQQQFIDYFDPAVLAPYREAPDKYALKIDEFEGHVRLARDYVAALAKEERLNPEGIDIRFTFRRLRDGGEALAAFLPDLVGKSPSHINRWRSFRIENPTWPVEPDSRFVRWARRYLEGEWGVDAPAISKLHRLIGAINALTAEVVDFSLFKHETNDNLAFPAAENTHRYEDAHRELYGYIIDGLDRECIERIATRGGSVVSVKSNRTVDALKKALPELSKTTPLWESMERISEQRRKATHSVRSAATPFSATEEFRKDVESLLEGLRDLLNHLETLLKVSGGAAKRRHEAKKWLPTISARAEPHCSINQIRDAVGKTIDRVEYGLRPEKEQCHQSEVIVIHFTDGSILGIETGSNSGNLATERNGLRPNDFHADFMLHWVPALSGHRDGEG